MIGGYDPSYNPENLEKLKASGEQSGELSEEQAEMAGKWAQAMENVGEAPAAEAPEAEVPAAEGGDQAEPTIAETEPQLQQQLAEHMDADGLPTDDEQTEEPVEEATEEETDDEDVDDGILSDIAGAGGKKHHHSKDGKPLIGEPLSNKMDPDKDLENMALLTPAGEMLTKSVEIAVDATKETIPEMIDKVADKIPGEGEAEAETEAEKEPETPEQPSAIHHFSQEEKEPSDFNPLPPEEQRDQKAAAEEAHGKTYSDDGNDAFEAHDSDNLVAQAIGSELGNGGVDLNGIGSTLKGDGVDIKDEVSQLDADTANDLSSVGTTGDLENRAADSATANNLAVESAANALAAKEAAGEATNNDDPMEAIRKANELADKAQELANASEAINSSIGQNNSGDMLNDAREMAEEAKDIANKAEAAAAEKAAEDKAGDDENKKDAKDVFSADEYPEMNDIGDGEVGVVTG